MEFVFYGLMWMNGNTAVGVLLSHYVLEKPIWALVWTFIDTHALRFCSREVISSSTTSPVIQGAFIWYSFSNLHIKTSMFLNLSPFRSEITLNLSFICWTYSPWWVLTRVCLPNAKYSSDGDGMYHCPDSVPFVWNKYVQNAPWRSPLILLFGTYEVWTSSFFNCLFMYNNIIS